MINTSAEGGNERRMGRYIDFLNDLWDNLVDIDTNQYRLVYRTLSRFQDGKPPQTSSEIL